MLPYGNEEELEAHQNLVLEDRSLIFLSLPGGGYVGTRSVYITPFGRPYKAIVRPSGQG